MVIGRPDKVIAADDQIDAAVKRKRPTGGHQMNRHIRLPGLEIRPARNQPAHQQGRFARQHQTLATARFGTHFMRSAAHQAQAVLHRLGKFAAGVRQENAAAAALEQGQPQFIFQQPHRAADRTVRNA